MRRSHPSMLFKPDNLRNTLLQIEMIFNIGNTIYVYSLYTKSQVT